MDRLDEALTIIRAMFTEEAPSFDGQHYRIAGARNVPRPVREGGPPIMVGGSGERRTLRLVAQHADLCNVFGSPDTLRHKWEVLEQHCAEVERDPSEITKSWLGTLVLTETADEAEAVKTLLSEAIGPDWHERSIVGDADDIVEQVSALVDTGVDLVIVNMPTSGRDNVARAGELLVSKLG
jgi:alkanesulfonate monooxygenase SsuD/methylene tetrahydromethanopterin reductase-like flavin-dependent oxidoreductase (luciferase family)